MFEDTKTLIDAVQKLTVPTQFTVTDPQDGTLAPVVVLPTISGLVSIDVTKNLDAFRRQPLRIKGTAILKDISSFIAHVNRFKEFNTTVFADGDAPPHLLAVIDYHCQVNGDDVPETSATGERGTRFCQHRGLYNFPVSQEWTAWTGQNEVPMDQQEFAAFLEERILDVLATPVLDVADVKLSESDQELKRILALLHGVLASPERMMDLSRGMAIIENAKVMSAVTLSSGEVSVVYEATHTDEQGGELKVPNLFLIGIPVFEGDGLYRVVVRLRYRKSGGSIKWFYSLYRAEKVFKHAFDEACGFVQKETDVPLLRGAPEA